MKIHPEMNCFFKKAILLVPILFIVLIFNLIIDPVHLTGDNHYEAGIAQLVLEGKNVTNIWNPSDGNFIQFFLNGLHASKEVLVFGSSRSKLIRSTSFPEKSFFNNSIAGASLDDYKTIFQMYKNKNQIPSLAILELSPWVLERSYSSVWKHPTENGEMRTSGVIPRLLGNNRFSQALNTLANNVPDMVSIGYFQTSFFTWLRGVLKSDKNTYAYFEFHNGDVPLGETILADGSAIYPERVRNVTEKEKILASAIAYGEKPATIPESLEQDQMRLFEEFVLSLINDSIRVVFYIPPYHPKTYEIFIHNTRFKIINDIQDHFTAVAKKYNITVIGSYNPADVNFDENDFFDGSHLTAQAIKKIIDGHIPGVLPPQVNAEESSVQIQIVGINNPNGLEVVNNKPFFWIGRGTTSITIQSRRVGTAELLLEVSPGPSVPEFSQRHLRVRMSAGYEQTVVLTRYPTCTITLPFTQGLNEVYLEALDTPTVLHQPNGDTRPLIIAVSDAKIRMSRDTSYTK